jgi:hypothetical protein
MVSGNFHICENEPCQYADISSPEYARHVTQYVHLCPNGDQCPHLASKVEWVNHPYLHPSQRAQLSAGSPQPPPAVSASTASSKPAPASAAAPAQAQAPPNAAQRPASGVSGSGEVKASVAPPLRTPCPVELRGDECVFKDKPHVSQYIHLCPIKKKSLTDSTTFCTRCCWLGVNADRALDLISRVP